MIPAPEISIWQGFGSLLDYWACCFCFGFWGFAYIRDISRTKFKEFFILFSMIFAFTGIIGDILIQHYGLFVILMSIIPFVCGAIGYMLYVLNLPLPNEKIQEDVQ